MPLKMDIQKDAAESFHEMARKADARADKAAETGDKKLEECGRSVAAAHRRNAVQATYESQDEDEVPTKSIAIKICESDCKAALLACEIWKSEQLCKEQYNDCLTACWELEVPDSVT
jgi:hypothetical protein